MTQHRALPYLFVTLALPVLLFALWTVPPMQSPDEQAHWFRAAGLSAGYPWAQQTADGRVGAPVDAAIVQLWDIFEPLRCNCNKKVRPSYFPRAKALRWSEQRVFAEFPGTAVYPPLFYVPTAAAIRLGQGLGWTVLDTYQAARGVNIGVVLALFFAALRLCRRGQPLLFCVGLMPMCLFQFGSTSQDGVLIALSALLTALCSHAAEAPHSRRVFAAVVACIIALATARYSLIGFGLLLWLPLWRTCPQPIAWRWRLTASALCLATVAAWFLASAALRRPAPAHVPNSFVPQLTYLLEHPLALPRIVAHTVAQHRYFWLRSFVGILGWLDTRLPAFSYTFCYLALIFAGLATALERAPVGRPDRRVVAMSVVATVAATLLIFLLYWTPVGGKFIEGIQGRYWISAALMCANLVPAAPRPHVAWRQWLGWGCVVAMAISLMGVPRALHERYHVDGVCRVGPINCRD